jgi:hypothetical protein
MEKGPGETVTIGESKFGKGIFAATDLSTGDVLMRITGTPLTFEDTVSLGSKESHSMQVGLHEYILVQPPFLYSNHSCDPNCGINENLELITIRPVSKGEELTWDYSTSMLERHWTMKCHCGAARCRGIVKDFDRLPLSIQDEYLRKKIVLSFIVHALQKRPEHLHEAIAVK